MNKEVFRVVLEKEKLTFSAAHFITFGDNICESLHGHNYGVRCEVEGTLNEHGYVVDFVALQDQLLALIKTLDHHVLLPSNHPTILVTKTDNEVTAQFEDRRWVFPVEDCAILPVSNTTAEWIAQFLAEKLISSSPEWMHEGIQRLVLGIDENQGQWGEYEIAF